MCERCIIYLNNILYHKGLDSARRMLCSDMWHRTALPTVFTRGHKALRLTLKVEAAYSSKHCQLLSDYLTLSSRSQHHLNHSCVTLKLRWWFQSTNLNYNFRNKVLFFNLALKVKLKVTLNKFFEEDSLIRSRLHMNGEVLPHLIPRLCV